MALTPIEVARLLEPINSWHIRWMFIGDMNGDGQITISDVGLWCQWLFYAPGDFVLLAVMLKLPSVATFFELTPTMLAGGWSFAISLFIWWIMVVSIFRRKT